MVEVTGTPEFPDRVVRALLHEGDPVLYQDEDDDSAWFVVNGVGDPIAFFESFDAALYHASLAHAGNRSSYQSDYGQVLVDRDASPDKFRFVLFDCHGEARSEHNGYRSFEEAEQDAVGMLLAFSRGRPIS